MRVDLGVYVSGVKLKDDQYDKMKAVYWACKEAGIAVPMEVRMYFNDQMPTDDELISVDISDFVSFADNREAPDKENHTVTINVKELPKDVDCVIVHANAKLYS